MPSAFTGQDIAHRSRTVVMMDKSTGAITTPGGATLFRSGNNIGGVTTVSIATENGISGTVATPTTTPVITLDASAAIDAAVATALAVDVPELIEEAIQTGRWEPLTNGNPSAPEILFNGDGDVLMTFVED